MARAHLTAWVGRLGQRQRHPEHRHQGIPHKLVQGALILEDQVHHLGKIDVEHFHHGFRGHGFRHGGKIADIGKEDRHLLAPPPQGEQPRIFQDFFAQFGTHIAGEGIPEHVPFLVEAQAAPQGGFVAGLFHGRFL